MRGGSFSVIWSRLSWLAAVLPCFFGSGERGMVHGQCVEGCEAIHTFTGQGGTFGWVSDDVGDLDGDGIHDLAITAPFLAGGSVHVYSGATGELLFPAITVVGGTNLGIDVDPAGDVDNDGTPDIIAGDSASGAGRAFVYSGVNGQVIRTFVGEAAGDIFGRFVVGLGDINDDDSSDLVIAAPQHDQAGVDAGRVYVYSGADSALLCTIDGLAAGDNFGNAVARIGDVDGDGKNDFAVGAIGAGVGGLVYVYSSAPCLTGGPLTPLYVLAPPDGVGASFGLFFIHTGDMNFDGTPDIYVSEFSANQAHVYSGVDGSLLRTFSGAGGFGIGRFVGDVNLDGHDDLILASWVANDGGTQAGKADIFSGRDGSILDTYTHNVPFAQFGFDANGMGDVNGDGRIDYLVTAANDNNATGKAYLLAGRIRLAPPASQVWVTGWASSNVIEYAADDGEPTGVSIATAAGGLSNAHSVRFGPDGLLYVTSVSTNQVLRFDAQTGGFIDVFVNAGGTPLNAPTDAGFGPDGHLYVASFNTGQVLRFDGQSGAFLGVFATGPGPGRSEMFEWGLDGHLYLATGQGNSVLRFDGVTGDPLPGPLGAAGTAEFVPAAGSAIADSHHLTFGPDGHLYVASMDNARIVKYDGTTGAFLGLFVTDDPATGADETGGLNQPHGIAFGVGGDLYVTSFGTNNVLRYDGQTGAFKEIFATGSGLLQPTHLVFSVNPADFDFDVDVDAVDAEFLQSCFAGPDLPTAPGCDATDIDGDGDADCDDWTALKVLWTGLPAFPPLFAPCDSDCNMNAIADDVDLRRGNNLDCNTNTRPDVCDIADGTSPDVDGNGVPDECCQPLPVSPGEGVVATNRYLSFSSTSEQAQAVRVTFSALPAPFDGANGESMWVGPPELFSEISGVVAAEDAPGFPTFTAATLQCQPFFADWTQFEVVHIYHERILPGGVYALRATDDNCGGDPEANLSEALDVTMARWGDVVKDCTTNPCGAPDGIVSVALDVVAILDKFRNSPQAPIKARCDIEPALPDHLIGIVDVTRALDAFSGATFPFDPGTNPCP